MGQTHSSVVYEPYTKIPRADLFVFIYIGFLSLLEFVSLVKEFFLEDELL